MGGCRSATGDAQSGIVLVKRARVRLARFILSALAPRVQQRRSTQRPINADTLTHSNGYQKRNRSSDAEIAGFASDGFVVVEMLARRLG